MVTRGPRLSGKRVLSVETALEGKTLWVRVRTSPDMKRYFRKDRFYIRYEQEIHAVEAVLNVPAVALLLPIAWITGASIQIRCLDRRFMEAAEALQAEYSRIYPKVPFGTRLIVDEQVDSPPNPEGAAMLFSGGLDATHTFFANLHLKPRLVEVFGTEFPVGNEAFLGRVQQETSAFARKHGVEASYVYTDIMYCWDHRALNHTFFPMRERVNGNLWKAMGYALGFLAMTAPLSAGRFNQAIIAAWANEEHADRMRENPDSSSPRVDEKIAWSNLRVTHHGCLHRYQKAREMRDWLPGNTLRVCWVWQQAQESEEAMNCSRCEKCARTMLALSLAGIDPEQCGFVVDAGTAAFMQKLVKERVYSNAHMAFWWGPMQRQIPEVIEGEAFGLRRFMEWFRTFDLGNGIDSPPRPWSAHRMYSALPFPLAFRIRNLIFRIKGESHWMNQPEPGVSPDQP